MAIMREEIFGPVLPILTWKTRNDAIEIIEMNKNPLALYILVKSVRILTGSYITLRPEYINEVIIQILTRR